VSESGPQKYANFERIAPQEKERILQACIEEFAQHGYAAASTNAMVRRAGIPKGTLFYYFGSKKDLYLYVFDHAVTTFMQAMDNFTAKMPADLFDRLLYRGRARMQFIVQHPRLYRFFFNALLNTPDEIREEMAPRFAGYATTSRQRLIDGLDRSKFREDVDVEKAIDLVELVLEGLYSRYAPLLQQATPGEALQRVEQITEETHSTFALLKKGLYKRAGP
jgi:AcrR family transcriptional regulator